MSHRPNGDRAAPRFIAQRFIAQRFIAQRATTLRCPAWRIGVAALMLWLASSSTVTAQSVEVTMATDRTTVGVDELFQLEIRVEVEGARADEIRLPDLSAFEVIARQRSQPMQLSFGFGAQQQHFRSSTIDQITLRAREPGDIVVAPVVARVGGRTYRSQPLKIHVSGRGPSSNVMPPGAPGLGLDPSTPPPGEEQAFLRASVDKLEPYVGEQATVALSLYTQAPLGGPPALRKDLSTDGFWAHDLLPDTRSITPQREIVGGRRYFVYLLRKLAVFPMRPGELTIGSAEVATVIGSPFDFFQRPTELVRASQPLSIRARALPKPATGKDAAGSATNGTSPAVGRLRLSASLDRQQARTGDAVTLTATLEGTGNLREARLALPPVQGLRALEPQVDDQIENPGDVVGGRRTYRWILVVEAPGTHSIPAFGLEVFDPGTGTFSRVTTAPLTLDAVGAAVTAPPRDAKPSDAPNKTDTLGPLRPRSALRRAAPPLSDHAWYRIALALPPLVWAVAWMGTMLRRRRGSTSRTPSRRARVSRARKKLEAARTIAATGDARALYALLAQLLGDAVEAFVGEPTGSWTHGTLRRRLHELGLDEALVRAVVDELEGYDFARFSAAGSASPEMLAAVDRVEQLLERLDASVATSGAKA